MFFPVPCLSALTRRGFIVTAAVSAADRQRREVAAQRPVASAAMPTKRKFHFGDIFERGIYKPLHNELFGLSASENWSRWLAPSFHEIARASERGNVDELQKLLREDAPGVYSFELFTPAFCDMLLAELAHAEATNMENLDRPNGMNRYGIVLNQLGLEPIVTTLQQKHLLKMQALLFPDEGYAADDHHCFIVKYKAGDDVGLDMHEDDSDVTLNVCLGKEFTAATLSFCGLACEDDHRKLKYTYEHAKGRAVIHRGRHRHGADNIETGERVNFILWSTNDQYRSSDAYHRHRMRSLSATPPDPICLSYTHDKDYTVHLEAPSEADALKRGVMLDQVHQRAQQASRPVHDLAKPLEEINKVPSVCLFMEEMPPEIQHALFRDFMHLAMEVQTICRSQGSSPPLFFVAPQPVGAVPQVRSILGLPPINPALAVLDVENATCYKLTTELTSVTTMKDFVDDFLQGRLVGEPLVGSGNGEEGEAKKPKNTDELPETQNAEDTQTGDDGDTKCVASHADSKSSSGCSAQ